MITDAQWKTIEETLKESLYERVRFRLPGDDAAITVYKTFISENETAIVVWINGERNGAWGWPSSDQFRPLVQQVWRRKTFKPCAAEIRLLSKTKAGQRILKTKEAAKRLNRVAEYWSCAFSTAALLVRQYKKIEGLELIIEPELTNV